MSSNEEIINTLIRLRNTGYLWKFHGFPQRLPSWTALSSTIAKNVQLYGETLI
jgi:hypothetical protein